jgi:3-deoxy-D-manno-octulosonate 8-phosphate phosphatase (KDO 8-P phosphatase)
MFLYFELITLATIKNSMQKNFKEILEGISTFIFDVDGVLTNGFIMLMANGEQVRSMYIKDCYAIQLAIKKGYRVAVISGGRSETVKARLASLGVKDVFLGSSNKKETFDDYLYAYNLTAKEILYMGDDMPDIEVMKQVAAPTCPNDASPAIMDICLYISNKKGGEGAVRDVIEQTLRLHGKWSEGEGMIL